MLPKKDDTNDHLIRISEAASILGVSTDTLRRWEEHGILKSQRKSGGHRYFFKKDIEKLKQNRPLTIAEAAYKLGVSVSTLRRLEERGEIQPQRDSKGRRLYSHELIKNYQANGSTKIKAAHIKHQPSPKQSPTPIIPPRTPQQVVTHEPVALPALAFQPHKSDKKLNLAKKDTVWTSAAIGLALALLIPGITLSALQRLRVPISPGNTSENLSSVATAPAQTGVVFETGEEAVLGLTDSNLAQIFTVNIPSRFNDDIFAPGITLDLGDGVIRASNIVSSLQNQGGDVSFSAGQGIGISGLTFSNLDPGSAQQFFGSIKVGTTSLVADANADALTFVAGDNITLTADAKTDKLTIAAASTVYEAGTDLDLDGSTFKLESTLDGVTTINGLTSIDATTVSTIVGNFTDRILEAHLKAVDTAADEECLTYEATVGDFEWQTCGAGGGISSFTVAGESGTSQTITDGDTLTITAGTGIDSVASATDTITISVQADSIDGASLSDTIALDAATLTFTDGTNTLATLTDAGTAGNLSITGDLTITGDDLFMTTNTSGFILVADGTNYNPVAVSGDITIDSTGATAIGADKVTEADLKAVDAAADEECLTYEATVGDFEWQSCGGGVTADSLDFTDFADAMTLDAATSITGAAGRVLSFVRTLTDATSENGLALTVTASDTTSGTTAQHGFSISNAASTEGLDALLYLDNADLDDSVGAAIRITSAAGTILRGLDFDDTDIVTDIELQNGETIDNNTDGTISLTAPTVTISGDLTITGDDLFMTTNTSGFILVADGTNYNPVAVSGDITIDSTGATAIGADKVTEADLKAVDAAADEECLTYEATVGDFEWQSCGGGGTTFDAIGDPAGNGAIAMAETVQTLDWNTAATSAVFDGLSISITNDATTDGGAQRLVVIENLDDAITTGTTEALLVIDNADTNEAVTDGILITSAAGLITDGIDASDAELTNALNVGDNTIIGTTAVIDFTDFDVDADGQVTLNPDTATGDALTINTPAGASQALVITATSVTSTTGIIDMNITAGNAAVDGLNIFFDVSNGATAGTDYEAIAIDLAASDADADLFGLRITTSSTAAGAAGSYEALILLENGENSADAVTDAILITDIAASPGSITDAIDASHADITNALNAGQNFILGDGIRQFSSSTTVWTFEDTAGNDLLTITDAGTAGNLSITGDLTITGDDLFMTTNTSGFILVADGTNYNPVAVSGDITIDSTGATAIGADKVTEADLKAVDAAADEECLTYEATVGDFEWQSCGGGVTADSLDFTDFADSMTLDAATDINASTFLFSVDLDSTGDFAIRDGTTNFALFEDDSTIDFTFPAAGFFTIDASSTANTTTTGVLDLNVGAGNAAVDALNIALTSNDGATAATDHTAIEILLTANDADADVFGLVITAAATTNAAAGSYEAAIKIDNAENVAGSMPDAILITAATNTAITDGLDVSDSNIVNAISVGHNIILGGLATIDFENFDVSSTGLVDINANDSSNDVIDIVLSSTSGSAIDIIATNTHTSTDGVIDMNVNAGNDAVDVINIALTSNDGATAATDHTAIEILLTANDADADVFGLVITAAATTNAAAGSYEAAIKIDNAENVAGSMPDAIIITATTDTAITDAIDVSDAEIVNALNIGANTITGTTGIIDLSNFDVDASGNVTLAGDLTITGDDLFMTTNTSGFILVADGTNYNPVAVSGDATLASSGALTIGADKILESHLKAVDAAADEECLTYEATVGDFEWQSCGGGSGNTLDQAYDQGGAGAGRAITVDTGAITMTVPIGSNNAGLEITQNNTTNNPIGLQVQNAGTGAGVFIDQNGNGIALSIDGEETTADIVDISGAVLTTGNALDIPDLNALTTGKGLNVASTSSAITSGELLSLSLATIADGPSNKSGSVASISGSRTKTGMFGTTDDNFDVLSVTRTNIMNGMGGTLTAAGSVLRVENIATPTAGTLTDTVALVELVQDPDSTGFVMVATNGTNNTLEVKNLSTNFGAAANAGAFIDRNSFFGWEFMTDSTAVTADQTPNGAAVDSMAAIEPISLYESQASGCTFFHDDDVPGGVARFEADIAGTGCLATTGNALNSPDKILDADNLPVMLFKVKPSQADLDSVIYIGMADSTDGVTAAPSNFIGFSNDNLGIPGNSWHGITRSAGTSTTVDCGVTVSTTQYALFMVEVRSTSNVRFFMDGDVSNGVSFAECSSGSSTNIPTAALAPQIHWQELTGGTNDTNLRIDFFRVWQDDAPESNARVASAVNLNKVATNLAQSSSLAQEYLADNPELPSGTLVTLDLEGPAGQVKPAEQPGDPNLVGVVVRDPGLQLSNGTLNGIRVATHGRAAINLSLDAGEIKAGDYLTSGTEAGVAVRANRPGPVIGMVVEVGKNGQAVIDINPHFRAGGVVPTLTREGQPFDLAAEGLNLENLLVDGKAFASQDTRIQALAARVDALEGQVAGIAAPAASETAPQPSSSALLPAQGAGSVFNTLKVEQGTELIGDLVVHADVTLYANLIVDTVHIADALNVHGPSTFLGEVTLNSDQTGFVSIPRGGREVEVKFAQRFTNFPLVQATPHGPAPSYWISRSDQSGFTLTLAELASSDLTFAWTALSAVSPITTTGEIVDEDGNGILDIDERPLLWPTPEPSLTPSPSPLPSPTPEVLAPRSSADAERSGVYTEPSGSVYTERSRSVENSPSPSPSPLLN